MDAQSDHKWFAFRVRSRYEKAVAFAARSKGFEEFLPLCRSLHRWSDRTKFVEEPLFPGYVFCRLNPETRFALLTIPGVMHMVGIGNTPEPLDDDEVLSLQEALRLEALLEPWPFVEDGSKVRLQSGPLAGLEGLLIHAEAKHHLVMGLSVLKQSVAVEIEGSWIEPTPRSSSVSV